VSRILPQSGNNCADRSARACPYTLSEVFRTEKQKGLPKAGSTLVVGWAASCVTRHAASRVAVSALKRQGTRPSSCPSQQPHTALLTLLSGAAVRVTLYNTHTTRTSLRRGSTCSCTQSARASGPSLKSSSEATRGGRGGRIRFCCTALESAALQEVEAWPPKSDIGPGRLRHSSPWRRERVGGSGRWNPRRLLVLLVNG